MKASRRQRPPVVVDFVSMMRDLASETDRGVALIVSAWLDDALDHLLRASVVQHKKLAEGLFGPDRPLGTFSARINVAFAFGVINTKHFDDLHALRAIRNRFAHTRAPMSFATPEIASSIGALHFVKDYASGQKNLGSPRIQLIMMGLLMTAYFLTQASVCKGPVQRPAPDETLLGRSIDSVAAAMVAVTGAPIP